MRLKNIVIGTVAFAALGTAFIGGQRYITLKPEDFEKATWIEVYNPEDKIWDAYMGENIFHNGNNWTAYQSEVKKRNLPRRGYTKSLPYSDGDLSRRGRYTIRLPDLDGDGRVNP